MTYQEVLDFLFTQFPQYQKVGGTAYKPGLENIKSLCNYLGNPQDELKIIHLAGTNGKGSTCNMLSAILQSAGYKVGLFTSPHLIDFRERIRVDGVCISEEWVVSFVNEHKSHFDSLNASFFEWTTALAFEYFKYSLTDVVVLETGLGGRLDATNVVSPMISAITNIGVDHTQYLGDTIELIASEKGGIIKPNVPVVISKGNLPEVITVLTGIAQSNNSSIFFANQYDFSGDLKGNYQRFNRGVAIEILKHIPFEVSEENIREGFKNTIALTGFRGRWEKLAASPQVIADIGHNYSGVKEVVAQLANESYNELRIVWGMVNDKEIERIVDLLPKHALFYLSAPDIERAFPTDKWTTYFDTSHKYELFPNLSQAYLKALSDSESDDLIFIGGSNFVVAEIISEFFK